MKKILCLVLSAMLLAVTAQFHSVHAGFKKLSASEWKDALSGAGLPTDDSILQKLENSGDTIEKIQSQTQGALRHENWVEVFKKLGLEPKPEMQDSEWAQLFVKAGIEVQDSPSPARDADTVTQDAGRPAEAPAATQTEQAVPNSEQAAVPAADIQPQPAQETPTVTEEAQQPPVLEPVPTAPQIQPEPAQPAQSAAASISGDKSVKISLDLRGADVYTALKMISQKTGFSIISSNNVRGSVTIYLQNVDALEALKMILEMTDLAYVQDGNVFKVMTAAEYEKNFGKKFYDTTKIEVIHLSYAKLANVEKVLAPMKSKIGQIVPDSNTNSLILIDTPESIATLKGLLEKLDVKPETKAISLNYAKPKDVLEKLKNTVTPGTGDIQIDERAGQVVISDTPERVRDIIELIKSYDKQHKEVIIEAKIVQIMLNDQFQMGVNWEYVFNKVNEKSIAGKVTGNLNVFNTGASAIRLNVGTLAVDNFNTVYDILQTVGRTNLVSSPKIATISNQEAKILVGTKEAYVTTTVTTPTSGVSSTAESVTFIDVGIKLYVTPNIGDDGFITLKIKPEVSSVDRNLTTANGNTIPIVRTSESETTVMVKDGVTIVIGGLMEERKEKTVSGVPILSRIPIIGLPFRRTVDTTVKTELAVFLTPRLITGDLTNITTVDKKKFKLK